MELHSKRPWSRKVRVLPNRLCTRLAHSLGHLGQAHKRGHVCGRGGRAYAQTTKKHVVQKIVLRLPDLDHAKGAVLNSLSSPRSRRNYKFAMEQFITWYCSEPRLALNRTVVLRFRLHLESLGLAAGSAV